MSKLPTARKVKIREAMDLLERARRIIDELGKSAPSIGPECGIAAERAEAAKCWMESILENAD